MDRHIGIRHRKCDETKSKRTGKNYWFQWKRKKSEKSKNKSTQNNKDPHKVGKKKSKKGSRKRAICCFLYAKDQMRDASKPVERKRES